MEVFGPLEERYKRSYTQRERIICCLHLQITFCCSCTHTCALRYILYLQNSSNPSHSRAVFPPLFLQLSLYRSLIINTTALTQANEDEAGICIISPTRWTSPTPDPTRASLEGFAQFHVGDGVQLDNQSRGEGTCQTNGEQTAEPAVDSVTKECCPGKEREDTRRVAALTKR